PRSLYQRTGCICKGLERLFGLSFLCLRRPPGGAAKIFELLGGCLPPPPSRQRRNPTLRTPIFSADCSSHAWYSASSLEDRTPPPACDCPSSDAGDHSSRTRNIHAGLPRPAKRPRNP